jgi:hypothetical protein
MHTDHASSSVAHHEFRTMISNSVHRLLCSISGHDLVLKVEPTRLALQCVSCPYESAGWTFDHPPLAKSFPSRRAIAPRPLVTPQARAVNLH